MACVHACRPCACAGAVLRLLRRAGYALDGAGPGAAAQRLAGQVRRGHHAVPARLPGAVGLRWWHPRGLYWLGPLTLSIPYPSGPGEIATVQRHQACKALPDALSHLKLLLQSVERACMTPGAHSTALVSSNDTCQAEDFPAVQASVWPACAEQRGRGAGRVLECLLLHVIAGPLLCCAYPWMAMQACPSHCRTLVSD